MSSIILLRTRSDYRVLDFINQQKGFTAPTPEAALQAYYGNARGHLSSPTVLDFVKYHSILDPLEYGMKEEIELDSLWTSVEEVCKVYPELFV